MSCNNCLSDIIIITTQWCFIARRPLVAVVVMTEVKDTVVNIWVNNTLDTGDLRSFPISNHCWFLLTITFHNLICICNHDNLTIMVLWVTSKLGPSSPCTVYGCFIWRTCHRWDCGCEPWSLEVSYSIYNEHNFYETGFLTWWSHLIDVKPESYIKY